MRSLVLPENVANVYLAHAKRQADIRNLYPEDTDYASLRSQIGQNRISEIDGIIYYDNRLYIPKAMRKDILGECHDSPTAGHPGRSRTWANIEEQYYWPDVRKDTFEHVDTCHLCQKTKLDRQKPAGLLIPIPSPKAPFEEITCDFIVRMPPSEGYTAICVFVDRLTKMAIFAATTNDVSSKGFAKLFLDNVYKRFGLPRSMITDRGTQYTADFWTELSKALGVTSKLSTAYHPQTDGQTEIVNQWLEQYLRSYVNYAQDDWVSFLPIAEFAYNCSKHTTTGMTPFKAMYGSTPRRLPSDSHFVPTVPAAIRDIDKLNELQNWCSQNIDKAQKAWKTASDRSRRDVAFQKGEKVLIRRKDFKTLRPSKKLSERFRGPYEVVRKINDNAYELDLPPGRMHRVFNVSHLKRYRQRSPESDTPLSDHRNHVDEPLVPESSKEYEDIKETRQGTDGTEYLVSWIGRAPEENTWVSETTLRKDDIGGRLLDSFLSRHQTARPKNRPGWKGWVELPIDPPEQPPEQSWTGPTSRRGRPIKAPNLPDHI